MTDRVFNFNPGPGTLPLPALELARDELLDFGGTGMSILEHSHRGPAYLAVHEETKSLLQELLAIPSGYQVLFMHGGARAQFALVPMNLLPPGRSADYVLTGIWAEKALEEAKILGRARVAATTKTADGRYTRVPRGDEIELDPEAAYLHLTTNNTVYGTQFHAIPDTGAAPLIADMSSDILNQPLDVSRFGLIYADAQKNAGAAGITVVIIQDELLARARTEGVPDIFRYKTTAKEDSLQNTIAVFAVYLMRNVLRWVKAEGGLAAMERRNAEKAALLYGAVDASPDFYRAPVEVGSRSLMNAVFRLPTPELEERFVKEATKAGMVGLKGHRSVGGIRASMYNAMPIDGVRALTEFMADFKRRA